MWGKMTSTDTSLSVSSASDVSFSIIQSLETRRMFSAVTGGYLHGFRKESFWIRIAVGSFALSIGQIGRLRSEPH